MFDICSEVTLCGCWDVKIKELTIIIIIIIIIVINIIIIATFWIYRSSSSYTAYSSREWNKGNNL